MTRHHDGAEIVLAHDDVTVEEWRTARRAGLGSSDAAAACGCDPWTSPVELYLVKRGEIPEPNLDDVDAVRWGRRFEDAIAAEFSERTGLRVHNPGVMVRHPEHPWMLANPDRLVYAPDDAPGLNDPLGLVECKFAGHWSARSHPWGTDDAPEHYVLQVLHQLEVTGLSRGWLVGCVDGRYRVVEIERDEGIARNLVRLEERAWTAIVRGWMPDPDETPSTTQALAAVFADAYDAEETVELDDQVAGEVEMLRDTKANLRRLEALEAEQTNKIKAALGSAAVGTFNGKPLVRWKASRRFDEDRFRADHPDLAEVYETRSIDRSTLKDERSDLYDQYMVAGDPARRTFTLARRSSS